MNRVLRALFGTVLVLLLATSAWAQATAQINGTVTDTSSGVLPGATVTAIQTDTGFRREVVTDATGSFTLTNLPIGPYRLEVTLQGFRTYAQTGIVLEISSNPVIAVTLELGQLAETVSVEASAPLVETRNSAIGGVIENERIEELPLNGRNAADLIAIAGAVVSAGPSSSRSMQGGVGYSVAGGQAFGVAYLLDGAIHNNPYDNFNLPLPFPDALQEFRVETSAQNAQNGFHSGASVNAATKSGHQRACMAISSSSSATIGSTPPIPFNAVDPATGERRDDGLKRNQFGGTLGGPIVADRLFFFGAYQGTKTDERPSEDVRFVPTAAMLAGDFTQLASAACNTRGAITLAAPVRRQSDLTRRCSARRLRSHRGEAPCRRPIPCGRVGVTNPRSIDEKQAIGRIDFQMSQNHSIFGRYMATTYKFEPPYAESGNILSTTIGGRDNLAQSVAIGDTMVLSNHGRQQPPVRVQPHGGSSHAHGLLRPQRCRRELIQLPGRLHARDRDGRVQPGWRHRERRDLPHERLHVRRRPDGDPRRAPVRIRRAASRSGIRCRGRMSGRPAPTRSTAA